MSAARRRTRGTSPTARRCRRPSSRSPRRARGGRPERRICPASAAPSTIACRVALTPRRSREASGPGRPPGPRRGIAATAAIGAPPGGRRQRGQPERLIGPDEPSAIAAPSTATATKLTPLLIRKKATERRAIRSPLHAAAVQHPRAEGQPAGAAGGDQRAHRELRPPDLPAPPPASPVQKIGPNMTTYETNERPSSSGASTSQPRPRGLTSRVAGRRRDRDSHTGGPQPAPPARDPSLRAPSQAGSTGTPGAGSTSGSDGTRTRGLRRDRPAL